MKPPPLSGATIELATNPKPSADPSITVVIGAVRLNGVRPCAVEAWTT